MTGATRDHGQGILDLAAFDPLAAQNFDPLLTQRLEQRAALFGAASVLFYDEPLEFVRGEGCWLFDAAGTAYLDAYNNVPSVGHAHPHVLQAATRQLALLNTHNRYLDAGIMRYAERLLRTLPPALSNITFTCTGSESNDLALRLAANFTGARGFVVTEAAYHGNTALVTQASPTLIKRDGPAALARYVAAPAPQASGDPAAAAAGDGVAARFAADVAAAILDLERSGVGFAALLVDGIFSSDGVYADPPGFLRGAVDAVHRAGGLFIADEVQCGFGRTGAGMWGFARHGVTPDVVTMGKPMGNGYPMGAVATRPDILNVFCERFGYFNTFGGSAVAGAVGGAVLDVLEREGLISNARQVGDYLHANLVSLAARHPMIGAVRGAGLYIGAELVATGAARGAGPDEAAEYAKAVINGLRDQRVLIGAAGKFGNVLKIRPPLCFSKENADRLIAALDDVLTQVTHGS